LVPINIVRPLVFVVHGIWSNIAAWTTFLPIFQDAKFFVRGTSYPNDREFAVGADKVYNDLKVAFDIYKQNYKVAAIQADVVAHSMGGPVVRTMALQPNFLNDRDFPTFGKGPVRRLITIDGVHLGTKMANYLLSTECAANLFTNDFKMPTGNGAVSDLADKSDAIQRINDQQTPFQVHTIVCLANGTQKFAIGTAISAGLDLICPPPTPFGHTFFPGFDAILQDDNDFLVAANSQRDGRLASSTTVTQFINIVHSDSFIIIPKANRLLNVQIVAERVIELLNSNDHTLFSPLFPKLKP
jgi:hypothetical protein